MSTRKAIVRLAGVVVLCLGLASSGGVKPSVAATPCSGQPAPLVYQHVIWIWFENTDLSQAKGHMPYLDSLASGCGQALQYYALQHPSLPNYMEAVTGEDPLPGACEPASCSTALPSLYSQLGSGWRHWEAGQVPCQKTKQSSPVSYDPDHNPPTYMTLPAVANVCKAQDLPVTGFKWGSERFDFVAPAEGIQDSISRANTWLAGFLPQILNSPVYAQGKTAILVTWDEGSYQLSDNHMWFVAIAPSIHPGTTTSIRYGHYSLLRTTERLLNLPTLGNATGAPGMRAALGL